MLRHHVRRRAGHRDVARAGDQLRERRTLVGVLAAPAEDEGGHADRAEHAADVGLVEHAKRRGSVSGPGREPHQADVPVDLILERHAFERRPTNVRLRPRPRSPVAIDLGHLALELGLPHAPRVVGRPRHPRTRVAEHECHRALGVRGGEHASERPAVRERDDHRPFAPHGIEHHPEVVDPLLDRRQAVPAQAVREPAAAVVEADQPAEPGEPVGERRHHREAVVLLELRHERPDQDDVDAAARPEHLVGDVDVAVPGVADVVGVHRRDLAD